jgi:hypothetical protein
MNDTDDITVVYTMNILPDGYNLGAEMAFVGLNSRP